MAKPLWKGTLNFGLMEIPVALFSLQKRNAARFALLEKNDLTPIRYERVTGSGTSKRQVPWSEVVKGREYEKGKYIVLEEQKRASSKHQQRIAIYEFVDPLDVDPLLFSRPYVLAPRGKKNRPYVLMAQALQATGQWAVASVVIRNKQSLAVIMERRGVLLLEVLHDEATIRDTSHIVSIPGVELSVNEMRTAMNLIAQMSGTFHAKKYSEKFQKRLVHFIERETAQRQRALEKIPPVSSGDILTALRQSLKATKQL